MTQTSSPTVWPPPARIRQGWRERYDKATLPASLSLLLGLGHDTVAIRNSNDTGGGQLTSPRGQVGARVAGCMAGRLDDLM